MIRMFFWTVGVAAMGLVYGFLLAPSASDLVTRPAAAPSVPPPPPIRFVALLPDDAARFGAVAPLEAEAGRDFDLVVPVAWPVHTPSTAGAATVEAEAGVADGADARGVVRLFFDLVDGKNYLAAEVGDHGARFLAVEEGLQLTLAEIAPTHADWRALPPEATLRLRRRWPTMELTLDGRTLLRSAHEGFDRGLTAVAAVAASPRPAEPGTAEIQTATPIYFVDDFMRMPEEIDAWRHTTGATWEVRSMDNPAKSANAFIYQGQAPAGPRPPRLRAAPPAENGDAVAPDSEPVRGGASLTGETWWSGYRTEVSVSGAVMGAFGLVLAADEPVEPVVAGDGKSASASDWPRRAAVVRWSASTASTASTADGADQPETAGLEILRVDDGVETVVARALGGFTPGRWHRLAAELADPGVIRVFIDGREALAASDASFTGGLTGIHVASGSTEFDDFRVISREVNGAGRLAEAPAPGWRFFGVGLMVAPDDAGALVATVKDAPIPTVAVAGTRRQENVHVEATVTPVPGEVAGLVAAFTGPGDYLALEYDFHEGLRRLVRYRGGVPESLDTRPWQPEDASAPIRLALTVDRGAVTAEGLEAFLPNLDAGRAGVTTFACRARLASFMVEPCVESPDAPTEAATVVASAVVAPAGDAGPVRFGDFRVEPVDPPLPLVSRNKVFDEEDQMALWSGTNGDWAGATVNNDTIDRQYFHRGVFFGDVELQTEWPEAFRGAKTLGSGRLVLSLAKPWRAEAGQVNGYYLFLERDADGAGKLSLRRGDEEKAALAWKADERAWPARLGFRKAGSFLVAYLDGDAGLVWRDAEPLVGPKIAFASKGLPLDATALRVVSRVARDYSFNDAPADFRVGGGVWEVANRWECDPRWAFFTGMPPEVVRGRMDYFLRNGNARESRWKADSLKQRLAESPNPNGRLVALWHKQALAGDQALETFQSQMMFQGNDNYAKFVKNFGLTICGDGRDVSSGYSFIFGGWNNTKSAILKNGVVVVETDNIIPTGGDIHRRWFHIRVEKQGPKVTFSVFTQDGRNQKERSLIRNGSMEYVDPEPLEGGQVAVWTYDSALCLARMRLGAESWGKIEDALAGDPGASTVFYDHPGEGRKTAAVTTR